MIASPVNASPSSPPGAEQPAPTGRSVEVFAHRGASGYRPEHTLAAYQLAINLGADWVEPDLVSTKDGRLVARHENEISTTTDVATRAEFAARKTTKTVDGVVLTGWFTEDFTLAELKTLRAVERIPDIRPANTRYDGRYAVPTLEEIIDLVKREERRLGRTIGIAPEIKHPTYFQNIGLGMEWPIVKIIKRNRLEAQGTKFAIQSFEVSNLKWLNRRTSVDLVQLTYPNSAPYDFIARGDRRTYEDMLTPAGIAQIAEYADWLSPEKSQVIPLDKGGNLTAPTDLVKNAHDAGLKVVVYTFRDENQFLPTNLRRGASPADKGDVFSEYKAFLATGIDGVFADQPDTAVDAVEWFEADKS